MRVEVQSAERPKTIAYALVFTLAWCGITGIVVYGTIHQPPPVWVMVVVGLFAVVGLALLVACVWLSIEYLKFGRVLLSLNEPSLATGGTLSAVVNLPSRVSTAHVINATLACVRCVWEKGQSRHAMYREEDVWAKTSLFPIRSRPASTSAELRFDIPAGQPVTDLPGEEDHGSAGVMGMRPEIVVDHGYHAWVLRIHVDVDGVDLRRAFRLRVLAGNR